MTDTLQHDIDRYASAVEKSLAWIAEREEKQGVVGIAPDDFRYPSKLAAAHARVAELRTTLTQLRMQEIDEIGDKADAMLDALHERLAAGSVSPAEAKEMLIEYDQASAEPSLVSAADWKDPTGRSTKWSDFLKQIVVHVPATSSLDLDPTMRSLREIREQAKAARPHDCPFNPGGYDDVAMDGRFVSVLSCVPPAVVERVRAMRLPSKTSIHVSTGCAT